MFSFKDIGDLPIPTLFVLGGIGFWVLAIVGSVAGKITVDPSMRRTAQIVGTAFIVLGVILSAIGIPKPSDTSISTAATTTTPASAPAAPSPKPTVALPVAPPAAAPPAPAAPPQGPSPKTTPASHSRPPAAVNCTGTGTPDEVAICSNQVLIDLEWQLHDRYYAMLSELDPAQQKDLKSLEIAWLKLRSSCKRDVDCLVAAYKSRLDQLK